MVLGIHIPKVLIFSNYGCPNNIFGFRDSRLKIPFFVKIFYSLCLDLCCLRFSPTRGSWYRLVSRLIGPKASSTSFRQFSFHSCFLFPAIFRTTLSSRGGRFICFYCIGFTILCSCWNSKPPQSFLFWLLFFCFDYFSFCLLSFKLFWLLFFFVLISFLFLSAFF